MQQCVNIEQFSGINNWFSKPNNFDAETVCGWILHNPC